MNIVVGIKCDFCQLQILKGCGVTVDAETEQYGVLTYHFCNRYESEYWKMGVGSRFVRWASEFVKGPGGEVFAQDDRQGILREKSDYIWRNGHLYP